MNTITAPDMREASKTYARSIHVSGRHRVALCKDGIQFLIQRRQERNRGPEWKSIRYCVTARALVRDWVSVTKSPVPAEIALLPNARNTTTGSLRPVVESG